MGSRKGQAAMSPSQVARRYARALYEAAVDADALPAVQDDMTVLSNLFSQLPQVLAWCKQGHGHAASAVAFVRTAFLPSVGPLTGRTLLLAAEFDRLEALPLLPPAFEAETDEHGDTVRVTLESAQPADADLVALLQASLKARTGRTAVFSAVVVPELVAGFRVLWNDRLIDRTARGRLRALRSRLSEGGSP